MTSYDYSLQLKKNKRKRITDDQIRTLAGNSICVPVLEAIFKQLVDIAALIKPEDTYGKVGKAKKKGKK